MYGYDFLFRSGQNWRKAAVEEQEMLFAAAEVIWHRSWQMMTGTMSTDEAARMLMEKPLAFAEAAQQASEAAESGDPAEVTRAAVRPLRHEARNNAARLRR